jgi:hypothetical protein
MNRLAQALLCLTNPTEKASYDHELFRVAGAAGVPENSKSAPTQSDFASIPVALPMTPSDPGAGRAPLFIAQAPPPEPLADIERKPPLFPLQTLPPGRKSLLRTVLLARRLLGEWQVVGNLLFGPNRPGDEAGELHQLRRRLQAISSLLRSSSLPLGQQGQAGYKIISLGQSQSSIHGLSKLFTIQGESLVHDWNAGLDWLQQWRKVLKAEIGRQRRSSWPLRLIRKLGRTYLNHAGTVLFLLGWLAIDLASPRLRMHWRGQLGLLVILAILPMVLRIRKWRTPAPAD